VVTEEQLGQVCTDTSILSLFPQQGGTYTREPGPVSHGALICTATPATGPDNSKVWLGEGSSYTAEAQALCHFMRQEPGMTVTMAAGS
jgi:hypothetical protein